MQLNKGKDSGNLNILLIAFELNEWHTFCSMHILQKMMAQI
jgi:hypothetical protein